MANLARAPSYPERILISRIVAVEWELVRQDARMHDGEDLSGHAMRARNAAENRLRLDLVALGLHVHRAPEQAHTLAQILARHDDDDAYERAG